MVDRHKGRTVTVRLDENLVRILDEKAAARGVSRNALLVEVLTDAARVEVSADPQIEVLTPVDPKAVTQAAQNEADPWARTEPAPHRHQFNQVVDGTDNYRMGIRYATHRCECGETTVTRVRA